MLLVKVDHPQAIAQCVDDLTLEVPSPSGLHVRSGFHSFDEDSESIPPCGRTEIIEADSVGRLLDEIVDDV